MKNRQTQVEGWSREIQIWGRGSQIQSEAGGRDRGPGPGPGAGKHKYPRKRTLENICKIFFENKTIDKVNLAFLMTRWLKQLFETHLLILILPLWSILRQM